MSRFEVIKKRAGCDSVYDTRDQILQVFRENPTWRQEYFKISDTSLFLKIKDTKDNIYRITRDIGKRAENFIFGKKGLIVKNQLSYDEARKLVKREYGYVILIKIRRTPEHDGGWKEPSVHELNVDQKKKLEQANRHLIFSSDRSNRITKGIRKELREISVDDLEEDEVVW